MPERVRGDVLTAEGRADVGSGGSLPGDEAFDGVAGQAVSSPGGEQRVAGPAAAPGEPGPQDGHGLPGQRGGAVFSAVAVAADVRRDVADEPALVAGCGQQRADMGLRHRLDEAHPVRSVEVRPSGG
jgi:hypothetical protein